MEDLRVQCSELRIESVGFKFEINDRRFMCFWVKVWGLSIRNGCSALFLGLTI